MDPLPPSRRRFFDLATIGLFLAAILAPTAGRIFRPVGLRIPYREKRPAEPLPSLALDAEALRLFPERFERWFDDTGGLRDKLLRWNAIEKLELLHVSPTPKVTLGEDDWLLYTEGRTMRVWRGLDPFSPAELEAWKSALEHNRDRLAARGIDYVFAIGPNKESIYPEKVPARFNRVGPTRYDQLEGYLREHSDFRMLDLRSALLAAKREDTRGDELYLRDGTHWNARGALVAYQELVRAFARYQPDLVPIARDRYELVPMAESDDSWRYRMGVEDRNPQNARMFRIVRPESRAVLEWGPAGSGRVRVTELPVPAPLRVLLLHDSFATYCEALLEDTVGHLAMHWSHRFQPNDLEVERPTVVVHLLVERALVALPPSEIELANAPTDREVFESSKDSLLVLEPPAVEAWGDAACSASEDGGLDAEFRGWKGLALLPEVPLAGGAMLSADVTSPVRTSLLLFYKQDPAAPYAKKNSIGVQIEAGRSRVFLRVQQPGIRGRIGLRTAEELGRLRIHALEIRRLPR